MSPAPPRSQTSREALLEARQSLQSDEASLEAEVLLMQALGVDRERLYQRLSEPLTSDQTATFAALLARRAAYEPLAYITGHREFFGLDFEVTPSVLIPRPETETVVGLAIAFANERFANQPITIVDVGTGSGAIAVALANAIPTAHVIAADISPDALAIARRNANHHGVATRIDFREGDLLSPLTERVQILAANLPYVTTEQWQTSQPEIRDHEPRFSLDGGADGLDAIRRLLANAPNHLTDGGALFCEIGPWQSAATLELAQHSFPSARTEVASDLAGRDRVLCVYA
ncbi:MAG: peptide chain release factor N(5)-glutamine methyltransferase [Chloroflexota bacterium]